MFDSLNPLTESRRSDESAVNRRQFLRNVGAAGGAAAVSGAGLVRVTTGEVRAATPDERRSAVENARVQSLLDALGRPAVDFEGATVETASVGSVSLTVTRLPTAAGPIVVGDGDGSTAAHFYVEDADRSALPGRFASIPDGTDATLYGAPDDVVLGRLATDAEAAAVLSATDADPDDALVFTTSEMEGFAIRGVEDDAPVSQRVSTPELEVDPASSFDGQARLLASGRVYDDDPDLCDDADWCWRCVQSTAVCGGCMIACGTAPTNPASAVGCALCLVAGCGATGFACSACVDCNT